MTLLLLVACSQRFDLGDSGEGIPIAPHDTGAVDTSADTGGDTATVPDAPLELCINEFMPENASSIQDETLAWPDWIELANPGDTALALDHWTITDFRLEPDKDVLDGGLSIPAHGFLLLWADGNPDLGPNHLDFKLDSTGGEVAVYAPDGRGSIVTFGPMAADFSVARVPDCCTGDDCLTYDFRGTPGASNVPAVYEDVDLLPADSTWAYWDTGTNPGGGWQDAGFDDSAWPRGPGPLGYGDAHQVTLTSYGADPANKPITTWFRTSVDIDDIGSLSSITLSLLRDDGARVFLNGLEVVRDNLPEGDLTDTTLATATTGGADETAYWDFDIAPTALVEGTNTLAVEVHQAAVDSSDLGFDLSLAASRLVTGGP